MQQHTQENIVEKWINIQIKKTKKKLYIQKRKKNDGY